MSDETTFFLRGNSVTCVTLRIVIEHLIISTQMQSHTQTNEPIDSILD